MAHAIARRIDSSRGALRCDPGWWRVAIVHDLSDHDLTRSDVEFLASLAAWRRPLSRGTASRTRFRQHPRLRDYAEALALNRTATFNVDLLGGVTIQCAVRRAPRARRQYGIASLLEGTANYDPKRARYRIEVPFPEARKKGDWCLTAVAADERTNHRLSSGTRQVRSQLNARTLGRTSKGSLSMMHAHALMTGFAVISSSGRDAYWSAALARVMPVCAWGQMLPRERMRDLGFPHRRVRSRPYRLSHIVSRRDSLRASQSWSRLHLASRIIVCSGGARLRLRSPPSCDSRSHRVIG